jgi:putative Mg2+ transporter-C (MgtC) family protein
VGHAGIAGGEIVLRLGLATLLCSIIGFERSVRDEVAGLRTHALVGLGAALFTLVSAYGFVSFTTGDLARADPERIAAQIVSGIGFLGAGAIIRQGLNVRGVTTASSLWLVAAIGMATGVGFYVGAVVTTAFALVVLILMRRVHTVVMPSVRGAYVVLDIELSHEGGIAAILEILARHRIRIESMRSELTADAERVHFELRLPPRSDFSPVLAEIRGLGDVAEARCTGLQPAF